MKNYFKNIILTVGRLPVRIKESQSPFENCKDLQISKDNHHGVSSHCSAPKTRDSRVLVTRLMVNDQMVRFSRQGFLMF